MSSVLYDVPGPRAVARNRILGVATVVVIAAVLAWILWLFISTNQLTAQKWSAFSYTYTWQNFILPGLVNTLRAFVVAAIGSVILAFILVIGRLSDHAWIRVPVTVVAEVFRAIPVLIFMMLVYYGLPTLGISVDAYVAVVAALIAYNGSVIAEALRAGVASLPRGQSEAGYSLGLRKAGVMTFILMPQAVRAMMPVILAQLVVCLKDTALGSIITYQELLYVAKLMGSQLEFGRPYIPAAIVIGVIYIGMCLLLSLVAKVVEVRMGKSPKAKAAQSIAAGRMREGATVTQTIGVSDLADLDQAERDRRHLG